MSIRRIVELAIPSSASGKEHLELHAIVEVPNRAWENAVGGQVVVFSLGEEVESLKARVGTYVFNTLSRSVEGRSGVDGAQLFRTLCQGAPDMSECSMTFPSEKVLTVH